MGKKMIVMITLNFEEDEEFSERNKRDMLESIGEYINCGLGADDLNILNSVDENFDNVIKTVDLLDIESGEKVTVKIE